MENQKEQILKALTEKHIEAINVNKLNTLNGGGKTESIRCPTDVD